MKCPFCNERMSVVDYELPDVEGAVLTCTAEECKPQLFLPMAIVPTSTGIMINLLFQIDSRLKTMGQIVTKKREGERKALQDIGNSILSGLRQMGFELVDGQIVMLAEDEPVIKRV